MLQRTRASWVMQLAILAAIAVVLETVAASPLGEKVDNW
jgi:hypothetical protein